MRIVYLVLIAGVFVSCKEQKEKSITQTDTTIPFKRIPIHYGLLIGKDTVKKIALELDSMQKEILMAVNRVDKANLAKLDTLVLPTNLNEHIFQYMPYAVEVPFLKKIHKIIFFSYSTQAFGAYEYGRLIYTGPTSMGRKKDMTPTGLYYANWKAEKTISTVNDEWELKWNFNIQNDSGIGFHQYAMPGYPASHSCLRLTDKDAQYLYHWTDEWVLKGTDSILAKGTPVFVFGTYPFQGSKPWFSLTNNNEALNIRAKDIEQLLSPHLSAILAEQAERERINPPTINRP